MANELFSLAEIKEYLGISGTDDDTLLEAIRGRARDVVESFLGFKVNQREFEEWHDGVGGRRIVLKNPRVTVLYAVRTGVANALSISSSTSTDIAATISKINDTLKLHRTDVNGDEVTTSLVLTDSANNTTKDLATVISAATGWSASVVKNAKSNWLHQVGGIDVVGTSLNLTYPDISETVYRVEYEEGVLYLRSDPAFVREDSFNGEPSLPRTRQSIFVNYLAGWSTHPEDIVQAALEIGASMFQRREHDLNLSSESLGDYSYSMRSPDEVSESAQRLLLPFRNIR
jgi:hypothetical protein